MLHVPSYNMGMSAGIAWKALGQEHFYVGDIRNDESSPATPRYTFVMSILDLSKPLDMFLPSSFFEGFYNAYHNPHYINM